ncbi:MAG: hypothetical protein WKG07_02415 [Hymenobacter sp.]
MRRLSEQMTRQATDVYALYHLAFEPRWFPVFYLVARAARPVGGRGGPGPRPHPRGREPGSEGVGQA